jgi:GMP synthase (glutamine-hydrolysing)
MAAGRTCLVLGHVAFEDLDLLAPIIAGQGYDIRYLQAGVDRIDTPTVVTSDLLVVLGGPIGVYEADTYPFLRDEIAAIGARLEMDKAVLGICLGAQLMAAALGARVAPGPVKEIGWAPVSLTEAGKRSVLATLASTPVLHWHGDNCELPAGCERLASTEHCPVQAFQRRPWQLALQFHLEVAAARFERWLIGHTVELSKAGRDPNELRMQARSQGATTAQAGRTVFSSWLQSIGAVVA